MPVTKVQNFDTVVLASHKVARVFQKAVWSSKKSAKASHKVARAFQLHFLIL